KTSYWKNRGKLDVPSERFISYPNASSDEDPSILLGWAGWDHREQAIALADVLQDRDRNHGWGVDRLTPLLVGLLELQPWLNQWHGEVDPELGVSIADALSVIRLEYQHRFGLTESDLRDWQAPPPRRGRPPKPR
ncbi:MAG: DUF7008 domain-containing protein, partial [Catenulispora sp.]